MKLNLVAALLHPDDFKIAAVGTNAEADGALLERVATADAPGRTLLTEAAERMKLSARGYHRVLRVARTLADMGGGSGAPHPFRGGAVVS